MMFHVSKIPQQAAKNKAAGIVTATTRTLASLATTTTTATDAVVPEVVVEDSFAFYPVQKNRVHGTYNPNQASSATTINRECFSYYPSNGIVEQNTVSKKATATNTATILDVASTKPENEIIISKDEWRSVIQERLMKTKNQTQESNQSTKPIAASETTIDDSFAFYPVQSNRVQTQENVVGTECFSFYPSTGSVKQQEEKNAVDEEEEKVHNFADGVPSHVKDHVKTAEFFGVEKKGSFEDSTPSPTDWESITIMQALKNVKKTTTTFAVAP